MAYTTINKPSDYFNTVTYTGNGSTQSINVGFQPDWSWFKSRDATNYHALVDSVRGETKFLYSNATDAEGTYVTVDFTSTGYDLTHNASINSINSNGSTKVAWNWKANGAGSVNYDGSISSTVSANTTAGFSIVSWSGTGSNGTIGHGLGATPGLMIIKNRNNIGEWRVWNSTFNADQYLYLNRSDAVATQSTLFNSTLPTSSVISVGTSGDINSSGRTYIAYCFAEKTGYSKFGSYTGNGSTDGTFVYTGFKPAFVMCKISSGADSWVVYDNKRDTFNVTEQILRPNTNGAEGTEAGAKMDLLSNGFKLRGSGGGIGQTNTSGGTYIYMAFASNPLVGTNNIPATAR